MDTIDIQSLTQPISADAPSGEDLEYDQDFVALEDAVRTEPEQQFGDTLIAATEPEWDSVRKRAVTLLTRTKDLRVALYLTQALIHGSGLEGLAQGLTLIRALLENYWDTVHPQLDPDDAFDPTARVNIIASLCDPEVLLPAVRIAPMIKVPMLGALSLRDLHIAKGEIPVPPDTEEVLKLDSIEAAMRDAELETLQGAVACVDGAVADGAAIEQLVTEKVGVTRAVRLDELMDSLREIQGFLREQFLTRGGDKPPRGEEAGGVAEESVGEPGVVSVGNAEAAPAGIRNAHDVTLALDKIIDYYMANEPSSPVPLLLQRAKRLVSADFMEILRDIAPDAVPQAEHVTGATAGGQEG